VKKLLLLLGLVVSATAMADVVELRVGSDLAHNGKFKGGQYSGSNVKLKKKSTRNGFELAGEYRKSLTDTWELGGGIAYRFNRISEEGTEKKGLHQVPLYLTTRYNFKNSSEITPYVKANLGYAFNNGKLKNRNAFYDFEAKFKSGFYTGLGTGVQYKNFVADLSYNWNNTRVERTYKDVTTTVKDKFTLSHGTLTLGVGYSFGL